MKASSANRILLGIAVAMVVLAFLTVAGDVASRREAGSYLFAGLAIAGMVWLGHNYRVLPRRRSFAGQASDLGFRAQHGDPLGLADRSFLLFRWMASVREVENTATGQRNGADIVVADYWFSPTSSPQRDDYERYTCVLMPAPPEWADISVVPERLASRIRGLAVPDIGTESIEFDRRFEVRSPDRRFASAFLDARMMAWLLEQTPGVGVEVADGWLMVFRPRATTSLDDLDHALELFDGFLARIPRVVFPGRPDLGSA